jgi:hypothetical protein
MPLAETSNWLNPALWDVDFSDISYAHFDHVKNFGFAG